MYVWFDALVNYISTLGWPEDTKNFEDYWPGIQVAGKDNLRQQSSMWQAMLMSAKLPPTKKIFIHGFITMNGQKMSKSLGNVIDPFEVVTKYGTDAVRYYLLREIPSLDDGDFSYERMKQLYDADLANELGNLVSRVTTLATSDDLSNNNAEIMPDRTVEEMTIEFNFNGALEEIWKKVKEINKQINEKEPWKKSSEERKDDLLQWLQKLQQIGWELQPFMPETGKKIIEVTSNKIKKISPLFPRI
jgi:methionyl-tRNA synthetase